MGEAGSDGGIDLGVIEVELLDPLCGAVGDDPPDGPLSGVVRRLFSEDCGDKVGWLEANLAFALDREDIGPSVRAALRQFAL